MSIHPPELLSDAAPGLYWTVVPAEVLLQGLAADAAAPLELISSGRVLQVDPLGDGTGAVRRLISACPGDYLDPRWQPGAVVPLRADGLAP